MMTETEQGPEQHTIEAVRISPLCSTAVVPFLTFNS